MKEIETVKHVCIVIEHSEIDLKMISPMTKKPLKFQTFRNSLKIVWGEKEQTKGSTTFMHSQLTLWNRFDDDKSHDQKAIEIWNTKQFTENSVRWKLKN